MFKKAFTLFVILLFSSSSCWAYELDLTKEGQYQKKIMETGFSILNANRIEKRVVFKYVDKKEVNAYMISFDKSVSVYKGLLPYIDNDAELAGILGHEIAHSIDSQGGYLRVISMSFLSKKYEEKADKKAVDYMVNAGYNPVAFIMIMNKIAGEAKATTHPKTSTRLAYIYEYIYKKYPAYLVENEYKENIYYQNFLLTSKEAREKIRKELAKNKESI